jgi:dCMP deaminase
MTALPEVTGPIRITFAQCFLRFARDLSMRGTCHRLKVGCVITSLNHHYVYGIGYNGNAAGLHNGCDSAEPGACGCLHAEENAVINCTAPRTEPKLIYCTDAPCKQCAKRLINLGGVARVTYVRAYRKTEGIELLAQAGIDVVFVPEHVVGTHLLETS